MNRSIVLLLIIAASIVVGISYSCSSNTEKPSEASYPAEDHADGFVGDQTCASCHGAEAEAWEGSHHDYAMKKATGKSVRADFSNITFTHNGSHYRFFRSDSLFMVEAPGPEGKQNQYQITHTFGWEPLQQYLVDFGKGKLQALNIAWDTEKKQWFAMNPEEDIRHGDWLHWTGGAMNWNTMCADCHSTNLEQNYIADADSFHTTWSSINVSCEACHGPGRAHVDFVQSEEVGQATTERIRQDLRLTTNTPQTEQVNQCAQCHSLREEVAPDYEHSGDYLNYFNPTLPHPDSYFADGQIKEEVYVYGSFLQSRMFSEEDVKCNDCHDPHSLELKANVTDNSLCMQCHEPRYNTEEHLRHEINTEASQCINCHMPGRYYMEVDFRRDHSFRVPRPDLSTRFDTPNACNDCHDEKSPEWAADAIERWYGPERPDHFSEVLARADATGENTDELSQLVTDTLQPDIARATALWYLGQFPGTEATKLLNQAIRDESPLVRNSAARVLSSLPQDQKMLALQNALDDSVRSVRIAAAGGLAAFSASDMAVKRPFKKAMEEYKQYLDLIQYFPQGQMNRGQFYENNDQPQKAIKAYEKALERDPQFNAARINLAYLYNSRGNNTKAAQLLNTVIEQEPGYGPAYYSLGLLAAEQGRLEQASSYFSKAAELMPQHSRVRYNWAISLQQLGKPSEAEDAYLQAIDLAPENPDYRYGLVTLYMQQQQYQEALVQAKKLESLQPTNRNIQSLLQQIKQALNK